MKTVILALVLTISAHSFAQSVIFWDPEIAVSDGSIYGNFRPRATLVDGDIPLVIYGKSGSDNLFVSRWNGSGFDTPTPVLPVGTSSYIADWTGPDIASKGDTVIAVFKLNPMESGNIYSVRSVDGGITFSDTIRVNSDETGNPWLPSMSIDQNGNPVVAHMTHDGSWANPRYVIVNSTDAGVSYTNQMEIINLPGEACDCCPAEMIVDDQRHLLLFRNNEGNVRDIHGVLSLDGGLTYPFQENIDQFDWSVLGCPATGPHGVFIGDELITVYVSGAEGVYKVYLSTSDVSTGLTYNNRTAMSPAQLASDTQNYPRISTSNDTTVMVWAERESGNTEIFYSLALTGANAVDSLTDNKWKANLTTTGVQTNPEVIFKNGRVHLFYSDKFSGDVIYRRGVIHSLLSVPELSKERAIYPNPTADGFVRFKDVESVVSVTNALGSTVEFDTSTDSTGLELEIVNPLKGIYFVSCIHSNGERSTQKVMVH